MSSIISMYISYKEQADSYAAKHADSYLSKAYIGMGKAVDYVTSELIPKPQRPDVKEYIREQLPKLTAAFAFGSIYDLRWLVNCASSRALEELSAPSDSRAARDGRIALFAIHTLKAVYNGYTLLTAPSLPTLAGCAYDAAALFTLNHAIHPVKKQ